VVEAGAGPGTLARAVLAAAPACAAVLRYILVERSSELRSLVEATMPRVTVLPDLPAAPFTGIALANELLDNLGFLVVERTATGWDEIRVAEEGGHLVEMAVTASPDLAEGAEALAPAAPLGARVPLEHQAAAWVREALGLIERGRLVVLDYARPTAELAAVPWTTWLRTYREHQRGSHPLEAPGAQDITCDVALDQLPAASHVRTQADFLAAHGLTELVEEGKAIWHDRAAIGDLAAIRARSRFSEAEALTDPNGLGGFAVAEWVVG
jgi:SAM-dependent MidA family methyltransferase